MSERRTPKRKSSGNAGRTRGKTSGNGDARRVVSTGKRRRRPAINRGALERMLRWALEANARQQEFLATALEILDPPELQFPPDSARPERTPIEQGDTK